MDKISKALRYYNGKEKEIIGFINGHKDLDRNIIISEAEQLKAIGYKIEALEIAQND